MVYINKLKCVEHESKRVLGVSGEFIAQAVSRYGTVRRERRMKNIITNAGMDAIGAGHSLAYFHVGTGTSTPDASDASLENFGFSLITKTDLQDSTMTFAGAPQLASPPEYVWYQVGAETAIGGATGTWTEIGLSTAASGGTLFSRALFLDSGTGLPTSFPVLADEMLRLFYIYRIYIPENDEQATVSMSGGSYDTTTRAYGPGNNQKWRLTNSPGRPRSGLSSGFFFAIAGNSGLFTGNLIGRLASGLPLGSLIDSASSVNTKSYVPSSFEREMSWRWNPGAGTGNVKTVTAIANFAAFQTKYDPILQKTAQHMLRHYLKVSWARR